MFSPLLLPTDDDRTVGVMNDVITDAAEDCPAHLAETAGAKYDHCNVLLFGDLADDFARLTAALRSDLARNLPDKCETVKVGSSISALVISQSNLSCKPTRPSSSQSNPI